MASGAAQYFPSFLPDGRRFLYRVGGSDPGIYISSLDSKVGKRITAGGSGVFLPPSWLLYTRGPTLVAQAFDSGKESLSGDPMPIADTVASVGPGGAAFSVSQSGVLAYRRTSPPSANDLTGYDRQGKRLGTVGEQATYTNQALSPDGKRLALSRLEPATNTRNIWVLDLARGVSSRFTFDKADETNPLWSPDGSRIAYSSARKGPTLRDIFWKASGGAAAEELLLEDAGDKAIESWSADGKLLLYNVGSRDTYAVPVSGDRKPYPVLKASFAQDHASLSPDGHWIAYVSQESARREVFVQTFPPAGGKWQISNGGGTEPSWRRDGKEIFL